MLLILGPGSGHEGPGSHSICRALHLLICTPLRARPASELSRMLPRVKQGITSSSFWGLLMGKPSLTRWQRHCRMVECTGATQPHPLLIHPQSRDTPSLCPTRRMHYTTIVCCRCSLTGLRESALQINKIRGQTKNMRCRQTNDHLSKSLRALSVAWHRLSRAETPPGARTFHAYIRVALHT